MIIVDQSENCPCLHLASFWWMISFACRMPTSGKITPFVYNNCVHDSCFKRFIHSKLTHDAIQSIIIICVFKKGRSSAPSFLWVLDCLSQMWNYYIFISITECRIACTVDLRLQSHSNAKNKRTHFFAVRTPNDSMLMSQWFVWFHSIEIVCLV